MRLLGCLLALLLALVAAATEIHDPLATAAENDFLQEQGLSPIVPGSPEQIGGLAQLVTREATAPVERTVAFLVAVDLPDPLNPCGLEGLPPELALSLGCNRE